MILISILVRFGMIESFLRYYFADEDQERRDALARRAVGFLLRDARRSSRSCWRCSRRRCRRSCSATATRRSSASRCSACGRSRTSSWPTRCCASTSALRTYAIASLINVGLTIGCLGGARGRARRGRARAAARQLRRLDGRAARAVVDDARPPARRAGHRRRARIGVLLRFGLPTVPAEASVYALSIIDRYYIFTTAAARRWPACTRSRSSSPARSRSSCARSSTRGRRSPTRSPTTPRRRDCMDW